jgi:hypothetical protein
MIHQNGGEQQSVGIDMPEVTIGKIPKDLSQGSESLFLPHYQRQQVLMLNR